MASAYTQRKGAKNAKDAKDAKYCEEAITSEVMGLPLVPVIVDASGTIPGVIPLIVHSRFSSRPLRSLRLCVEMYV
jgi:hypothetical protein